MNKLKHAVETSTSKKWGGDSVLPVQLACESGAKQALQKVGGCPFLPVQFARESGVKQTLKKNQFA